MCVQPLGAPSPPPHWQVDTGLAQTRLHHRIDRTYRCLRGEPLARTRGPG